MSIPVLSPECEGGGHSACGYKWGYPAQSICVCDCHRPKTTEHKILEAVAGELGISAEFDVIPDAIEPIEGYRAWSPSWRGKLLSLTRRYEWKPGINIAGACRHGGGIFQGEKAPMVGCACGFYAIKADRMNREIPHNGGKLFGKVNLSGKVIRGEHGWRAEEAEITAIIRPPKRFFVKAFLARRAAKRYDVPLVDPPPDLNQADGPALYATFFGMNFFLVWGIYLLTYWGARIIGQRTLAQYINDVWLLFLLPFLPFLFVNTIRLMWRVLRH